MGYSSKASLFAAVESLGKECGLTDPDHLVQNWKFTQKSRLSSKRERALEDVQLREFKKVYKET